MCFILSQILLWVLSLALSAIAVLLGIALRLLWSISRCQDRRFRGIHVLLRLLSFVLSAAALPIWICPSPVQLLEALSCCQSVDFCGTQPLLQVLCSAHCCPELLLQGVQGFSTLVDAPGGLAAAKAELLELLQRPCAALRGRRLIRATGPSVIQLLLPCPNPAIGRAVRRYETATLLHTLNACGSLISFDLSRALLQSGALPFSSPTQSKFVENACCHQTLPAYFVSSGRGNLRQRIRQLTSHPYSPVLKRFQSSEASEGCAAAHRCLLCWAHLLLHAASGVRAAAPTLSSAAAPCQPAGCCDCLLVIELCSQEHKVWTRMYL